MFGQPSLRLRIALTDDVVFVRPSPDPENIPSEDPIITGRLILNLSKPQRITSLTVRLVNDYSVRPGPPTLVYLEGQDTISEVSLSDDSAGRVYVKGEHVLMFVLVVPSSTAPYTQSKFGRIQHKIVAVAQCGGSKTETSIPLWVSVNPALAGETSSYNICVKEHRETLGRFAIEVASQHLTVGGLIRFDFRIAQAPTNLNILSVSAHLDTSYRIASPTDPTKVLRDEAVRTLLFEASDPGSLSEDSRILVTDGNGIPMPSDAMTAGPPGPEGNTRPLQKLQAGGAFYASHLARLPSHDVLSASTIRGTRTPIDVQHQLVLQLRWSRASLETREPSRFPEPPLAVNARVPMTIASCCCMVSSVLVPSYAESMVNAIAVVSDTASTSGSSGQASSSSSNLSALSDSSKSPPQNAGVDSSWYCICSASVPQLISQHMGPRDSVLMKNHHLESGRVDTLGAAWPRPRAIQAGQEGHYPPATKDQYDLDDKVD